MRIDIQTNQAQVSAVTVEGIKTKVLNLEKYHEGIHDAKVFLKEETDQKVIELKLNLKDSEIFMKEKQSTFQHALDNLVDTAKIQLKKYKERHN
jgi:putative sigma-54 modulation protein